MSLRFVWTSALVSALVSVGCGGSVTGGSAGPCESEAPPPECSLECSDTMPCPAYYYCDASGECTADCTPTGGECGAGNDCNLGGTCEPDDGCPDVSVNLTPVVPTVILLIDQSGSMTDPFGNTDRWNAVREALNDPQTGVLPKLDDRLILGATLYSAEAGGTCPALISVPPALGNAAAVATLLADNEPIVDTPTAEAIEAVVEGFPASDNPRILVLATDGNPDTCLDPDANDQPGPRLIVEDKVEAAWNAGITTYVLSVGAEPEAAHLERVARLGQGQDPATGGATPYIATSPDELLAAFGAIVGGATSCQVNLDGQVDLDRADEGVVVLNGSVLAYGTDWTLLDEDTLELLGDACTTYLSSTEVALDAEFPCGGVVVE